MSDRRMEIVFLDVPGAHAKGQLRRRVSLRIDGEDVDGITLRLDSDHARERQAKKWAEVFDLDVTDLEGRLRQATVTAIREEQERQNQRESARGAKSAPPIPPHPLSVARPVFERWLTECDPDLLDVVFGAAMAHRLEGDPVWLFIIGAPGDGKTELLRCLSPHDTIYTLSSLTPGALISGFISENGPDPSLLPKLDGKVLVVKDFTTVLTMPSESRAEILGTLRDAYDGEASKAFGTGETKSYRSRFGLLAAVTPVIDKYWGVSAQLGERFLRFRLPSGGRQEKVEHAIANTNNEEAMRAALTDAALGVLAQTPDTPSVPAEINQKLAYLADFLSRARSEVGRDHSGVVQYIPSPEVGTRVGKAIKKLAMGIAMARGDAVVDDDVYRIILRVALDTIPSIRARLLRILWDNRSADQRTPTIADAAEVPTDTAKTWLHDLRLLRIADRGGDQHSGYMWRLREAFQITIIRSGLWQGCGGDAPSDFAPLTTFPASEEGEGCKTTPRATPDDDDSDRLEREAIMAVEAEEG